VIIKLLSNDWTFHRNLLNVFVLYAFYFYFLYSINDYIREHAQLFGIIGALDILLGFRLILSLFREAHIGLCIWSKYLSLSVCTFGTICLSWANNIWNGFPVHLSYSFECRKSIYDFPENIDDTKSVGGQVLISSSNNGVIGSLRVLTSDISRWQLMDLIYLGVRKVRRHIVIDEYRCYIFLRHLFKCKVIVNKK
jgi:hypothetical protein